MSMWANILGGAAFGLASRFGQLGIQKRNLFENLGGHAIAVGVFGYAGYWAWRWDNRSAELLAERRDQIAQHRRQRAEAIASASSGSDE